MKVIDLLNKIANGEEVPEIILFNSYEYRFDKIDRVYRNIRGNSTLGTINELDLYLNDEIEIIEEKKIPEKLDVLVEIMSSDKIGVLTNEMGEIQRRFNQLIDYLESKGK